jgi:hypothetical protein
MRVINWLDLQPLPADLDALNERLKKALPLRKVCQLLVETTLRAYPWTGRIDLISCYHPSQTYKQGQRIALLIPDSQKVCRGVWLFAQVKHARIVENPIQGRFQVLTLDPYGKQVLMVGGIPDASYPEPDLSDYTSEDLAWQVEWVSDTYAAALQATLKKLIQKGQLCGQLVGQTFLPEHVSALSVELLQPRFARISAARPWISLEEIFRGLSDLSQLKRETALGLIRATLKESSYRSLGADRWTTPELFNQFNREVPRGLTTPLIRSKVAIWMKQDEQDLAGYGRKFMPAEARRVLEEFEVGERLPEPDDSPWRPPNKPVRLPSLNYLHITQAYFPVGYVMRAFAPEVQMVFVQFMDGDHQPFLLDRENGLLKAVHPEELRTKILRDGIPAGTHLWLEYEGSEQYRIAPRQLPFKRLVPCKLASLEDGQLHIEHTQISMKYEGDPSLFKANLRFEDLEALFAEASRVNLSVRDAMIYAMQEICATDLDHRAHSLDIFNAVFLKRMCSPSSVSFLLYTQPCFEPLGSGYFRYKPMPDALVKKSRKRRDRLSQLWDGLLSKPVAPDPQAQERMTVRARLEVSYPVSPTFAPDLELSSLLREPETEPEISVAALPLAAVEEDRTGNIALKDEERVESFLLSNDEPDDFTPTQTDAAGPVSNHWRDSLERLLHSIVELEDPEHSALPIEETNPETEAFSDLSVEAGREESTSFSSPFRWEPKPAWINVPIQSNPPLPNTADTRRLVYKPKIPIRPLHKQPFYRRIFFYLRSWLSKIFRKTV